MDSGKFLIGFHNLFQNLQELKRLIRQLEAGILSGEIGHCRAGDVEVIGEGGAQGGAVVPRIFSFDEAH